MNRLLRVSVGSLLVAGLCASVLTRSAQAVAYSWIKLGDGVWSEGTNWDAPPASDPATVLNFTTGASYSANNDLASPPFILNQLNFGNQNAGDVTLNGNQLQFAGTSAQINQNSSNTIVVNNNLDFSTVTTLGGAGSGNVYLAGTLTSGVGGGLTITGAYTVSFSANGSEGWRSNDWNGGTLTIGTGATLIDYDSWMGCSVGNANLVLAGGTIRMWSNLGNWNNGPHSAPNTITLAAGTTSTIDCPYDGEINTNEWGGHLQGAGSVNFTGQGNLYMGGPYNNSYTGNTRIAMGPNSWITIRASQPFGGPDAGNGNQFGTVTVAGQGGMSSLRAYGESGAKISNPITLQSSLGWLGDTGVFYGFSPSTLVLAGALSGTGQVVTFFSTGSGVNNLVDGRAAPNMQILQPNPDWSGGMVHNSGILSIANGASLGTGAVTMGGAVAELPAHNVTLKNATEMTVANDFNLVGVTEATFAKVGRPAGVANNPAALSTFDTGSQSGFGFWDGWSIPSTTGGVLTLTGKLSGTGGLQKKGPFAMILSGSNTYSGPTVVQEGVLRANAAQTFSAASSVTLADVAGVALDLNNLDNSIGSLTGGGAIGGNVTLGTGTLTIGGDGTSPAAYTGEISGAGGIAKIGGGRLTLAGSNAYTGTTTVTGGELATQGTLKNILTVNNGAITPMIGLGSLAVNSDLHPETALTLSGVSTYNWQIGSTATSNIAVNGDLSVTGTPTVKILSVDGTKPVGTAVYNLINYTGNLLGDQPVWNVDFSTLNASTFSRWQNGDGQWNVAVNWDGGAYSGGTVTYDTDNKVIKLSGVGHTPAVPGTATDVIIAPAGGAAVIGPSGAATINTLQLGNGTAATSLTVQYGGPFTVTGATTINNATLTLNDAMSTTGVTTSGVSTINGTGTLGSVTSPLSTITVASGETTFGGTLTAHTNSLAVAGTATLGTGSTVLTKGVTGAGTVKFDGGTLKATADIKLSSVQGAIKGGGAVIDSNGNKVTINTALAGGPYDGGLTVQGGGSVVLQKAQTYTGSTTIQNGGTLKLQAGASLSVASGLQLWLDAADMSTLYKDSAATLPVTANGDLVGAWADKSGNSGRNVVQSNDGSKPNYQTEQINGLPVIRFNGSNVLANSYNPGNTYSIFTASRMEGTQNQRLITANNNWLMGNWGGNQDVMYAEGWVKGDGTTPDGNIHLYGATGDGSLTSFYDGNTLLAANNGGTTGPNGLSLGAWQNDPGNEASKGDITEIVMYDRVLSAEEITSVVDYLNAKWVTGGGVGGGADMLPTTTALTITSGGKLDLNDVSQQVGSLGGAGSIINNGKAAATLTVSGSDAVNTVFSGAISDGTSGKIALTKAGASVLTLSGPNSYTGATTVRGSGKLLLGNVGATPGSMAATAVSVTDTATYGLTQTSATKGAMIAAGTDLSLASGTTLNLQDAAYNTMAFTGTGAISNGATLAFDIDTVYGTTGNSDKVTFTGDCSLTGSINFAFRGLGTSIEDGTYTILESNGLGAGFTLNNTTPDVLGSTLALFRDDKNIYVTVTGNTGHFWAISTFAAGGGSGEWSATSPTWAATDSLPGGKQQGTSSALVFGADPASAAPYTVTVTGPVSVSKGMTFTVDGYNLANGISAGITLSGAAVDNVITVATAGHTATIEVPISGSNGLIKTGAGKLVLTGANTYTGVTTVNNGALELGSTAASHVLTNGVLNGVNITASSKVIFEGADAGAIENILKAGAHLTTPFSSGQIRSSTAGLPTNNRALGWQSASDNSSVTVMYTLYGDATLDGVVNFDDLSKVLTNYNGTGNWGSGDVTYDGVVNFDDLSKVLTAYNTSIGAGETGSGTPTFGSTGGFTVVPEPSSVVLLVAGLMGLVAYGWRKRK